MGPVCGSLKENELSKTSLNDQGEQTRSVVAQATVEEDPPEVIKGKEKEELKCMEDKDKAAEGEITRQLDAPSRSNLEHGTESKIYFETSSKSHEEEISQSYYELGGEREELHEDREGTGQKVNGQTDKRARAQRSLSLNIPVGSLVGQIPGANPKAFSERLSPLQGSFDQSEMPPLTSQQQLFPVVSVTPTSTEISKESNADVETPALSEKLSSSVEHSPALSEMLDLAGALPRLSSERRDLDHMRRKSMPSNVSELSGSSLASLVLSDDASKLRQENHLEEQGYCVFSEYSGPMPSPANITPSPIDCLHQHFPSEAGADLGRKEAEKVLKHVDMTLESSQKLLFEKKDSPVKSSLVLEKAVSIGAKPDRLRIPTTFSKDRLTEFRLETGLPGDLKIQAIPEVDIEKDPSREASPIPPDTSFTFSDSGTKAPPTPITPKSPEDQVMEMTVDRTTMGQEGEKRELDNEKGKELQTTTETQHRDTRIEAKVTDDSSKNTHFQTRETTPDIVSPKPFASSTVIIIPQAKVEEADDEDFKITEEPQEMMEDPAVPLDKEQTQMSQVRDAEKGQENLSGRENDPKSGDEWSQSSNNGEDGEPATDSSHLSPYSDYDRGEKKVVEVPEIQKDAQKEELGRQTEKWKMKDQLDRDLEIGDELSKASDVLCQSGEAGNTETTQDVSCVDTDSGWMDSQGTQSL